MEKRSKKPSYRDNPCCQILRKPNGFFENPKKPIKMKIKIKIKMKKKIKREGRGGSAARAPS